jgi:TPR repeat protein
MREIALHIAARLYKLAANAGGSNVLYALFEIWKFGEPPVAANPEMAAVAAEAHAIGGKFLGLIEYADVLEHGIGVSQNAVKVRELLERAHTAEFSTDQMNDAYRLRGGEDCREDLARALQYYKIAAENGQKTAMSNLGIMYQDGSSVPADLAEAAKWFKKSADAGCDRGQLN